MEQQEEWPADIDDLIEFLPQLVNARHQLDMHLINLRQHHWNKRLSDAENYARIPGLKQLRDFCALYDDRIGSFPEELSIRMHALPMADCFSAGEPIA